VGEPGPVLLVGSSISEDVYQEVLRLGPSKVVLLGGPAVLSL
jgi:hypothetical protein